MSNSCCLDFSASGFACQAGLLSDTVARHKGISLISVMLCVEKVGELLCKNFAAKLC